MEFRRKVASNFDDDSLCICDHPFRNVFVVVEHFLIFYVINNSVYVPFNEIFLVLNKTSFFVNKKKQYILPCLCIWKSTFDPINFTFFLIQYNVICDTLYTHISVDVGSISAIVVLALE